MIHKKLIDSTELSWLIQSSDFEIQKAFLTSSCDVDYLDFEAREKFHVAKISILRNTKDVGILEYAVDKRRWISGRGMDSDRVLRNIILNPLLSPEWENIESFSRSSLLNKISDSITEEDIRRVYRKSSTKGSDIYILRTIALVIMSSQDLLRELSLHQDRTVRACVTLSRYTSPEVLNFLSSDPIPLIGKLSRRHPNFR